MGLGCQKPVSNKLFYSYDQLPKSPGHKFYDKLQDVLFRARFDSFAQELCRPYYADERGRPSIPPGRYFRMLLIGYFEGIASERQIAWRCSDSLSLQKFLQLDAGESVPEHSSMSKIRKRLPASVYDDLFNFILNLLKENGLSFSGYIGIDSSYIKANAAMRKIKRRDNGLTYREMLKQMAMEDGNPEPSTSQLIRNDKKRKGKKVSNKDWKSGTDPDSRIARMKDGSTHLAYKPEHAVDCASGVILAAVVHEADKVDTKTIMDTLEAAEVNLITIADTPPQDDEPATVVADKGYYSQKILKELDDGPWISNIAEPHGVHKEAQLCKTPEQRAVYINRTQINGDIGLGLLRTRGEVVERSFEHVLDRTGGMRRTWLRGRENIQKRYLLHVAGFNLSLLMRKIFGFGTPRMWAEGLPLALYGTGIENFPPILPCLVLLVPNMRYIFIIFPVIAVRMRF